MPSGNTPDRPRAGPGSLFAYNAMPQQGSITRVDRLLVTQSVKFEWHRIIIPKAM